MRILETHIMATGNMMGGPEYVKVHKMASGQGYFLECADGALRELTFEEFTELSLNGK